jgi:hypothetical protein
MKCPNWEKFIDPESIQTIKRIARKSGGGT